MGQIKGTGEAKESRINCTHGIPEHFALIGFESYMREAEDLIEVGCETCFWQLSGAFLIHIVETIHRESEAWFRMARKGNSMYSCSAASLHTSAIIRGSICQVRSCGDMFMSAGHRQIGK